jgi:hypothetical protein
LNKENERISTSSTLNYETTQHSQDLKNQSNHENQPETRVSKLSIENSIETNSVLSIIDLNNIESSDGKSNDLNRRINKRKVINTTHIILFYEEFKNSIFNLRRIIKEKFPDNRQA